MRGGRSVALIGLLLAASSLSACSLTRQSPHSDGSSTGTASPSGTSSVSSPSSGGSTTAPAEVRLKLGQSVTRDWSPKQGVDGRIRLRVTHIERADWTYFRGWQVSRRTQRTTHPFFIKANVANVGKPDLGGYPVPLYALDAKNQLVEASTFGGASGTSTFKPCNPGVLPKAFKHGATVRACLVMLVPSGSAMVGASFRPDQSVQPVTWVAAPTRLPSLPRRKGTAAS